MKKNIKFESTSQLRPVIIAVDSSPFIPIAWARALRREFQIIPAVTATHALQIMSSLQQIDLVITELRTPVESGPELIKVCQELYPEVPRILITGIQNYVFVDEMLTQVEVSDVLFKPIFSKELSIYVSAAIDVSRRQSAVRKGHLGLAPELRANGL